MFLFLAFAPPVSTVTVTVTVTVAVALSLPLLSSPLLSLYSIQVNRLPVPLRTASFVHVTIG